MDAERLKLQFGGTPFFIHIFGMMFMINLEETPILQNPVKQEGEPADEILEAISKEYEFEIVSLN